MSDKTSGKATDLLYLFDRPTEPVFMPKGENNAVFDVPKEYLSDRYKPLSVDLLSRFGTEERIPVKKIVLPDLSLPLMLGRRENFSLFLPHHRAMAARLIEIFMGMRNLEDFISASVYCRDRINPYMYIYALSVAIIHRPDTKHLSIPSLAEVFPDKYMDGAVFAQAKEESNIVQNDEERQPLIIPRDYTATDLDVEHRLAYWREDLGINLHHYHWHLVYPGNATKEIVDKDRRGELFYYMHHQMLARYNAERLSNHLGRVKRLNNWREPMAEGYFPKLDSLISSRVWPPRFANTQMRDVQREEMQIKFDLADLERWRDRIYAAIHSGVVVAESGETIELTEGRGIDILGNLIESSVLSVNRNLYGDLHNLGHVAIALCHDPDNRNLETFSVLGDTATSMRDPIFYRWHAFIDDIFQEHKNTLPRYSFQELDFPGVKVTGMHVQSDDKTNKNELSTYWQQSDVDLSRGLDFTPRGTVYARFTHLQHSPFKYSFTIENNGPAKKGYVRIFMAPKHDERDHPMLLRDQSLLFIEMDKFVVDLKPKTNIINRNSTQSNVTIPFERTFRNLAAEPTTGAALDEFNFCGCGWPHHLLVPKGTAEGFLCQLFVMVSDYSKDEVPDAMLGKACADASSYCGIRDSKYPDKKAMGFPFDRLPRAGVINLSQFMTSNMGVIDVTIYHSNRTIEPAPKMKLMN